MRPLHRLPRRVRQADRGLRRGRGPTSTGSASTLERRALEARKRIGPANGATLAAVGVATIIAGVRGRPVTSHRRHRPPSLRSLPPGSEFRFLEPRLHEIFAPLNEGRHPRVARFAERRSFPEGRCSSRWEARPGDVRHPSPGGWRSSGGTPSAGASPSGSRDPATSSRGGADLGADSFVDVRATGSGGERLLVPPEAAGAGWSLRSSSVSASSAPDPPAPGAGGRWAAVGPALVGPPTIPDAQRGSSSLRSEPPTRCSTRRATPTRAGLLTRHRGAARRSAAGHLSRRFGPQEPRGISPSPAISTSLPNPRSATTACDAAIAGAGAGQPICPPPVHAALRRALGPGRRLPGLR